MAFTLGYYLSIERKQSTLLVVTYGQESQSRLEKQASKGQYQVYSRQVSTLLEYIAFIKRPVGLSYHYRYKINTEEY